MNDVFFWIGLAVSSALAVAALIWAVVQVYFTLLHNRFGLICFRKTAYRLSLAQWHRTRLKRGDGDTGKDDWPADDWPLNERPVILTIRIGNRRLILMAGILSPRRSDSIRGTHP